MMWATSALFGGETVRKMKKMQIDIGWRRNYVFPVIVRDHLEMRDKWEKYSFSHIER